ncbi:hypothetical protein N7541_002116 [Penicillium brevicompactum]|uniref:Uncharacterized protein n=1 Tax=Penicillium brevicompactum TaxID=5074 RepID=A0A9W9UXP5_PENBR|nr:hypothetical protein N7541_002116 [Penicillium brevicompactum]
MIPKQQNEVDQITLFTPKSLGVNADKLQKPYRQYMKQKPKPKSELEESSRNAIAADRQHRYDEILRYMHIKNAAHQEHSDAAPKSSAFSSSGHTITLFTHRFSVPRLKLQMAGLRGYPIPGVFTTVVTLLVVVWIAIFTIGLVELCNYVWSRQSLAATRDPTCDDEGPSVELDELTKIPFSVVMISEEAQPGSPSSELGSLDVTSEFSSTDSDPEEDDYRML